MPTKLSNSENVQAMLKLSEQFNVADDDQAESLILKIHDLGEDMSLAERYSFSVRLIAQARNIVPTMVDLEIELLIETDDVEEKYSYLQKRGWHLPPPQLN